MEVTARLGMTLMEARTEIDRRESIGYDAVVLTLGTADALAALPTPQWSERFELLLTALLNKTRGDTQILALGAHPSSWAPYLHPHLTRMAARRLVDYNQVCRELCWSLPCTSYLAPLDKVSAPTTQYSAHDYERIARTVAAHLAHRLARPSTPSRPRPSTDTSSGHLSLASLGLLDQSPRTAVARIVARAQAAFGVEGAVVTELPGTEASPVASVEGRNEESSTEAHSPAAAAANAGGLAIANLRGDARFQNSSWVRRHGISFYAAHPIYGASGQAIAVLAIFDPQPRTFSPLEMAVLRDHALLIQEMVSRSSRLHAQQASAVRPPPAGEADTDQEGRRGTSRRTFDRSPRSRGGEPSSIPDDQWR